MDRGAAPSRSTHVPKHRPKGKAPGKAAASAPAGPTKTGAPKRRSFLRRRWWLFLLLTPVVAGAVAFVGLYVAYARIQLPEALPPIQTTYVYDRNGHLLSTLHGTVNRTLVPLSQVSPHMIDAVIATEDHDFYNHPGIDPMGIARAAFTDIVKRDTVQGASTITEQLVKNVYAGSYTTGRDGVQSYTLPTRSVAGKDPRGAPRDQARAAAREGPDPREVPQHRLLRPRRLRGRGGGRDLLPQARERADRAGVGVAGRRAARARALRPDRPAERQLVPTQLRDRPDGALRLSRREGRRPPEGAQVLRHGAGPLR